MMGIENILQPNTTTFIKDVGFPIASFIIMVSILMYVMKKDEKRQEKTESRYERLVDKFIETSKEVSERHDKSLKDITTELKNITSELKIITTKIDTYSNIIDEKLEARSPSYIFKEGKQKELIEREKHRR